MANVDAPFGLRPIGNRVGVANFQTTEYQIKDNVDNDMFQGDPLEIDTSNAGYVFGIAAVTNPNSIGALSGVMISKDPSTGKPKFSPINFGDFLRKLLIFQIDFLLKF